MKKTYQTEQRKNLIDFLSVDKSRQYTIEEVISAFKDFDGAPGRSTVYRLMTKLTEEGMVRRFNDGSGRRFLYQIVEGKGCIRHFHMKCLCCGKLIHLDDEVSHLIFEMVSSKNNFAVDGQKSILFGKCGECVKKSDL